MFSHRVLLTALTAGSIACMFISYRIECDHGQVRQLTSSLQQALDGLGVTVPCDSVFEPVDCDFKKIPSLKVEDYERCGPLRLNQSARNFYLGATGRRITYNENKAAFRRIRIIPKLLRDVSKYSLETSTLGQTLSFPIGLSPTAMHKLAHPDGEIATVRAISNMSIIMILSCASTVAIEEVAENAKGGSSHLWMQTYIFTNRSLTVDVVSRAEKAGFKAVVVTIDSPVTGTVTCSGKDVLDTVQLPNIDGWKNNKNFFDKSLTFRDLAWIRNITRLPIIAKGILSVQDARSAIRAGASAIFVSNHGGRQMDGAPATIDVLPGIVDAVRSVNPGVDVYVDSGIRNGYDLYKAIASGAKMAFIGRPQLYGLAMEGEDGVRKIINILRREFEEAMLLSGASRPSQISRSTLRYSKC